MQFDRVFGNRGSWVKWVDELWQRVLLAAVIGGNGVLRGVFDFAAPCLHAFFVGAAVRTEQSSYGVCRNQ
ncbi:hypothetical protein WI67_08675 [Burkholderia cepacia]|nr:hypothetical protein WI67_08675 [Burkholderia cepacia]